MCFLAIKCFAFKLFKNCSFSNEFCVFKIVFQLRNLSGSLKNTRKERLMGDQVSSSIGSSENRIFLSLQTK